MHPPTLDSDFKKDAPAGCMERLVRISSFLPSFGIVHQVFRITQVNPERGTAVSLTNKFF